MLGLVGQGMIEHGMVSRMIHQGFAKVRRSPLVVPLLMVPLPMVPLLMAWLAVGEARGAEPRGAESPRPDRAVLAEALARFDAHAFLPLPELDTAELGALASGELIRLREPPTAVGMPQRVVGLRWLALPRPVVWLACQDPHFSAVDELTEFRLDDARQGKGPDGGERAIWYGLIDLPWPFKNRQWVIEVWDNQSLVRATEGQGWEHIWRLDPSHLPMALAAIERGEIPGITPQRAERAIVTPVNHGAWLAIEVAGGTLLGWHATSSIGGSVSDRLVVSRAFHSLERLFWGVERRARRKVTRHYWDDHPPLRGGDGRPLPLYATPD